MTAGADNDRQVGLGKKLPDEAVAVGELLRLELGPRGLGEASVDFGSLAGTCLVGRLTGICHDDCGGCSWSVGCFDQAGRCRMLSPKTLRHYMCSDDHKRSERS